MADMKRLFVALLLPEDTRDAVTQVQTRLRDVMGDEGIRWTKPEQFHFTLKFLGEVEDSELPSVVEGVEAAAARSAQWNMSVATIGVFPRQRNPQVLWVGASIGVPVLQQAAQYLNEELAKRNFPSEAKPYIPHITLARMKTRDGEESVAKNLLALQADPDFQTESDVFPARECVLMQSDLRREGAVYTVVKSFAFSPRSEYNT